MVVGWCFSSEDQYLFKKCFLRSALIFVFLCSTRLKFENVFLKLFQSIMQWYLADCVPFASALTYGISRSFLVTDLVC